MTTCDNCGGTQHMVDPAGFKLRLYMELPTMEQKLAAKAKVDGKSYCWDCWGIVNDRIIKELTQPVTTQP